MKENTTERIVQEEETPICSHASIAQELIRKELEALFLGVKECGEIVSVQPSTLELYPERVSTRVAPTSIRYSNGYRYALRKSEETIGVAVTHPGFFGSKPNASNEDDFYLGATRVAVADGLGGLPGGAEASKRVTEALGTKLQHSISDIVEGMHYELHAIDLYDKKSSLKPSTTLVAAELHDGVYTIQWAGDSRAILFNKNGEMQFISKDDIAYAKATDTKRQEDLDAKGRNIVSNSIGAGISEYVLHKIKIPAVSGDYLMLMSDGVTDNMNSEMLERYMKHCLKNRVSFHDIPLKLLRYLTNAQKMNIRPRTESDPKPAKSDAITILLQMVR